VGITGSSDVRVATRVLAYEAIFPVKPASEGLVSQTRNEKNLHELSEIVTLGIEVYPQPAETRVIEVMDPPNAVYVAFAPLPPPPMKLRKPELLPH